MYCYRIKELCIKLVIETCYEISFSLLYIFFLHLSFRCVSINTYNKFYYQSYTPYTV